MPRGKQLSDGEQIKILTLHEVGMSGSKISKTIRRSKAAVNSFLRNPQDYDSKKRTGRPKSITVRQARQIRRLACGQKMSSAQIQEQLQLPCTNQTLHGIKGEPLCVEFNDESSEFRVSSGGYLVDMMTQDLCKQKCAEQKFTYIGLMKGSYCLCGNDVSEFEVLNSSLCDAYCPGNSEEICGSNDTNVLYTMEAAQIGTVYNISLIINDQIFYTDEAVEIEALVQANTEYIVIMQFGDGSSYKFLEEPFFIKKYYRTPGEYKVLASARDINGISPELFDETYITVEDRKTRFKIDCPKVVKPETDSNCTLSIISGTSLTMNFQMSEDEDISPEIEIPDPFFRTVGQPIPPLINETQGAPVSADIVYLAYSEVKFKGLLLGFEYYVMETGNFEFLVLSPTCGSEDYCEDLLECGSSCNPWNTRKCGDDKALCSYVSQCVDMEELPGCHQNSNSSLNFKIKHSFDIESADVGYNYFSVPTKSNYDVVPGDIIGFKVVDGSSLWYRNSTEYEIKNGIVDMSDDQVLGVLHYLQAVTVEPFIISLAHIYNKTGNYSISVTLSDLESDYSQNSSLPVQLPLSNVHLEINKINVMVGRDISACITANGSNLILHWDYLGTDEKEFYDDPVPQEGLLKNITCNSGGDYVLSVNVSNLWNSEYVSAEFHCFEPIGKNWTFDSDSPKSTPPGEVIFNLKFSGSELPSSISYFVEFGDGSVNNDTEIVSENDEWETSFSHNYDSEGNFNVTVNISNPVDFKILELTIQIYEKMSNLSVDAFYVISGSYPDDKLELKGKNKTDAPRDATLYFENNITGHVTLYKMEFEDGSFSKNFSDNIIQQSFPEAGEWEITFKAWNSEVDEYSNEVKLLVRILNDVSDIDFNASKLDIEVDETTEFEISVSEVDSYTCLMFDGGDDGRLIGFGNKDVCTLYYDEGQFKFIKKSSSRKRREASKADWIDDAIRILYSYGYGGEFPASVDVFNSVSRLKKNLTIAVSDGKYKAPLIWIDKNSTDIENPIECQRGYDCRYETTAIFRSDESYLASHFWTVYSIDSSRKEEEIDISELKTSSCSAIRIVKRSLAIGLYKLKYTLTVYAEDEKEREEEVDEETEEYDNYYYRANQNSEDEEEDLSIMFENRTILARRSVSSYLRIIPTPLIPMLINGGASYITRGFGQTITLEPTIYTEDPDFPDDQNYEVTWFCIRSDKNESLTELKKHEYDHGNPSSPITDRSTVNEKDDKGGCFGKGPGLIEIGSSDYELNSNMFWTWSAVYKISAVIEKDEKVTESQLFIKVLEERPPSLRVMCEKRIACFPDLQGLYINPNSWIPLKVECIQDCGNGSLQYEWNVYTSNLKSWERNSIDYWEEHVTADYDRMGLNQSLYALNPDINIYLVEVTGIIPDSNVPKGVSSLFLIINHPPANGNCHINASSGMALLDSFLIEFSGWEDEEGHEIYDYSVYVKYGEETLRLSYGMKTKVLVVLPFGDLEIWCSIQDHLGAVTMYSAANFSTGLPNEDELEGYDKNRLFEKALAEGKMALASQIIIAKNSVLMEYRRLRNRRGDFDDVSEAAIDARWHEYLQLDGIDSSYYTPQARDEIREELREIMETQMDRDSLVKNKEITRLLRLPMEALPDAEIFGGALSAVADNGPTDLSGKLKIMRGMESMFQIINMTDVPHPEDKKIVFSQFGNLCDTIAGSLAESNIAGNFLPGEIKRAEEVLDYNATEPNYFIFYVEGNRTEVQMNLRERAVEAAKDGQSSEAKEMVLKIKDMISTIQQSCMEEIMVGPEPFYTESRSGFRMTFFKNHASNLSNEVIQQGDSSITLPDLCTVLNNVCEENDMAVGIQAVRWTQPLESYGMESDKLSERSNVIQVDITSREGNSTISVTNSSEIFKICIPVSIDNAEEKMEYVVPSFSRADDILVYHTIFIESSGLTATVNIKPDDSNAPFIVMYKYGDQPSLFDYEDIMRIQDMNYENGIYSLFIGSDVISEAGKNLSIAIGHAANTTDLDTFFDNPDLYNLSVVNMTNQFSSNYAIEITTTGCYYFSDAEEKWSTKGCQVVESGSGVTCCECNHLTSFGSGFFITPNNIDFNYVFANAAFETNITIYATIIVTFSVFVLFLIYARWKDRKDVQKLGATPLPDNEPADKYIYEILVFTGHQRNAGTKSNVFFIVSGEEDETEVRHLADDKRPILQKSSVDVFVMSVPRSLGQLNYLRIWHDNTGSGKWSSWYCQYIVFRDVQSGFKYEFLINRWFGVEYEDGMIDRLIPVAGREQVTEFSHLFSTTSRRNLADSHLWFSVFLRPPRSRFTRVQRVCCCMAVLCLSMLSNAMYYERTSAKPSQGGFKFGPLSLSPEQIGVGLISNFLIFPPTFFMIFFFRKSRPRKLRQSRIEQALREQRSEWKKKNPEIMSANLKNHRPSKNDAEAQLYHKKKKFSLPWWCIYFGWLMVVASIGASIFFMWAYGIAFGDEKTSKWLSSLIIAFISSVLITQPMKIILMAIVASCLCRSMDYDEDDADEDEEDPHLRYDEEFLHDSKRSRHLAYQPMDLDALEEARKEREKEVKMYSVLREISAYFLFLWVITILSYGNRDPNNFYLREALINGFIKPGDLWVEYNNVNTETRFWNWTYNALVPELFALQWYNGREPLGLRLYLDDRNNLKIGYAVMRQVRIQPRSCKVPWVMEDVTPECAGFGNLANEDGTLYTIGWRKVNSSDTLVPPEYKYLTASQLKGYPFWGQIDWYGGGGYVVPLVARRDSDVKTLIRRLESLEKDGWIDKYTRAIFVEFGVYNAQINLFCSVTILAEFLPGGGVIPYYHIDPLRLLNYHTGFGLFQAAIEVIFVIFTIFFTVKELKGICREGRAYFSQYWNVAELVSIVVSYTGIINHVYKIFMTKEILRIFTETEGTGYVKLQEAVLLNELFCYQIGLVMSISTLKFLKLLRFNKRIGILSSTLRMCAQELQSYSVCLMVVFMAFVVLFWLLLGRNVREFSTFIYSFESSISMMLKKFNYDDMYAAQPILTPMAFFTFSLATAVVLINILLSIIIRSFEDVKHDVSLQSNEYEILDFFINRMKMLTGIGTAKVRPLPNMYRDKKKPKDSVSCFPDKVDRLVDFINDFYFDNQIDFNGKDFLKKMNAEVSAAAERETRKAKPVMASKSKIPRSLSERFDDF